MLELHGEWWKSFMSSTNAPTVPFASSLPVGSSIFMPFELSLYARRQGLHVCTQEGVPSQEPCPEPQKGEVLECMLKVVDTPWEVVGKYRERRRAFPRRFVVFLVAPALEYARYSREGDIRSKQAEASTSVIEALDLER